MIRINTWERYLSVHLMLMYRPTFRGNLGLIGCCGFVLLAVHAVKAIFSLSEFLQRGMYGKVRCKRGESSLTPCLKAFCLDSFLPFQAPITVCQKKKIFMVGWSWLCVWEALSSSRNMGTDIMPLRTCVCERERGWAEWHFINRFCKGENLV